MAKAPREVVYEVYCYRGLIEALRARINELNVAYETVDRVSGLPSRYTGKLLSPTNGRSLGSISLQPLLATLGLKILLVEDQAAYDQIKHRLEPRRWAAVKGKNADVAMPTRERQQRRAFRGCSAWGKLMRARATISKSAEERSSMARHAAIARWKKRAPF
jgi:hypothetical protein